MKISFTHNVHNRHKTLKETILMERNYFPDSNIYVGYNIENFNKDYFKDIDNLNFKFYNGKEHKIGCVNGCISTVKNTLNDDSDVVVFSHDDVMINPNYVHVFNENVKKIIDKEYDIIYRKPHSYGEEYAMMEGFFMSKEVVKDIFSNIKLFTLEDQIPKDGRGSPSPEVWLYNILNSNKYKINSIEYNHNINNYNKTLAEVLGFFHKNAGLRGWND